MTGYATVMANGATQLGVGIPMYAIGVDRHSDVDRHTDLCYTHVAIPMSSFLDAYDMHL